MGGVKQFLAHGDVEQLFAGLENAGFQCIGPQLVDGAIAYRALDAVSQLPQGIRIEQQPGSYRAEQAADQRYFAWTNGPQALKPLVFPPQESLWQVVRDADGRLGFSSPSNHTTPQAVLGVRPCDLAALQLNDEHFLSAEPDPGYQARRSSLFLVVVNCSHPSSSCFCTATGDGPSLESGGDLVMDETDSGFVLGASSPRGSQLLEQLALAPATAEQLEQVAQQRSEAASCQSRTLPTGDLHRILSERWEHPHWQNVADRCLACGNCTAVCPTCFCHTEFDVGGLDTQSSEHVREWDSCFGEAHSYIHGTVVRSGIRQRYRQWLGHKFGNWFEQYGRSGCVGCGRCITWCPVGIEVTAELAALCGEDGNE